MITEIPAPEDFKKASINLLVMAWGTAMSSLHLFEQSDVIHERYRWPEYEVQFEDGRVEKIADTTPTYTPEQREEAAQVYWERQQPSLSNALVLIQQAVELGLKGRIAAVSPFLLIARDARDYPKGSDQKDVPFSEFRSIDSADLLRVHNTVAPQRLGQDVGPFWDKIRRQRNLVMHLGWSRGDPISAIELVSHILFVNQFLHPEMSWPKRLLEHDSEPDPSFPGVEEINSKYGYGWMLYSITAAARHLPPSLLKCYFGFDSRTKGYDCPRCIHRAREFDSDEPFGKFAQLRPPRSADTTTLYCFVCEETMPVLRRKCSATEGCRSSVLSNDPETRGECLLCGQENDLDDAG